MADDLTYVVAPEHMTAFGSIVQGFARHEYLMQGVMGSLLAIPLPRAYLITAGLGYTGKRDAILSLLRVIPLDEKRKVGERIKGFLGKLHTHNQLRNHIAHSLWIPGAREHSIKPFGATSRGGTAKFVGLDPAEPDYLLDELVDIAEGLVENYDRFVEFLNGVGLLSPPQTRSPPG